MAETTSLEGRLVRADPAGYSLVHVIERSRARRAERIRNPARDRVDVTAPSGERFSVRGTTWEEVLAAALDRIEARMGV